MTKIHVFWFSPVYHTRLLALSLGHALSANLGEIPTHSHDITNREEACVLGADELAVFAIPVYAGRVPPLALERLHKIKGSNTPVILLASYGNRAYDNALRELLQLAEETGCHAIAAAACIARHTIGLEFATGRPNAADLAELEDFAEKIVKKLPADETLHVPGDLPDKPAGVMSLPQSVNENCVLCGHCWEQCPAKAITPQRPADVDKKLCICCMRCVAICPERARIPEPAFIDGIRQRLAPLCSAPKQNEFFGV